MVLMIKYKNLVKCQAAQLWFSIITKVNALGTLN